MDRERQRQYLQALKRYGAEDADEKSTARRAGVQPSELSFWRSSDPKFKKAESEIRKEVEIPYKGKLWLKRYREDMDRVDAAANVGCSWKEIRKMLRNYPAMDAAYKEIRDEIKTRMIDKLGRHGLDKGHAPSLEKWLKHEFGATSSPNVVQDTDTATAAGAEAQMTWARGIFNEESREVN